MITCIEGVGYSRGQARSGQKDQNNRKRQQRHRKKFRHAWLFTEKEERNAINRAKEDDNEESLLDDEEEDQYSLIGVETIGRSSGMEGEGEEEDVFLKL